jgi:hypothetical protein
VANQSSRACSKLGRIGLTFANVPLSEKPRKTRIAHHESLSNEESNKISLPERRWLVAYMDSLATMHQQPIRDDGLGAGTCRATRGRSAKICAAAFLHYTSSHCRPAPQARATKYKPTTARCCRVAPSTPYKCDLLMLSFLHRSHYELAGRREETRRSRKQPSVHARHDGAHEGLRRIRRLCGARRDCPRSREPPHRPEGSGRQPRRRRRTGDRRWPWWRYRYRHRDRR